MSKSKLSNSTKLYGLTEGEIGLVEGLDRRGAEDADCAEGASAVSEVSAGSAVQGTCGG